MSRIIDPQVQHRYRIPLDLTRGQVEILRFCAEGATRKATAARLGTTEQNVKNSMTRAYRRIGARNVVHAVALLDDQAPGWRHRTSPAPRTIGEVA